MSYFKYSRTPHLPWSESSTSDDVWSSANFLNQEIVVTEKLDGENTSMYFDHIHARSTSSVHHPSRSWVKQLHASLCADIPKGWRICGENLFAYHSILYLDLPSYFMCFGIYDDSNYCISWDDTVEMCELLSIPTVPVLYRGVYDEKILRNIWNGEGTYSTYTTEVEYPKSLEDFHPTTAEGYVVRIAQKFHYNDFAKNVAKWVRKGHVQTTGNWMQKPVYENILQ